MAPLITDADLRPRYPLCECPNCGTETEAITDSYCPYCGWCKELMAPDPISFRIDLDGDVLPLLRGMISCKEHLVHEQGRTYYNFSHSFSIVIKNTAIKRAIYEEEIVPLYEKVIRMLKAEIKNPDKENMLRVNRYRDRIKELQSLMDGF